MLDLEINLTGEKRKLVCFFRLNNVRDHQWKFLKSILIEFSRTELQKKCSLSAQICTVSTMENGHLRALLKNIGASKLFANQNIFLSTYLVTTRGSRPHGTKEGWSGMHVLCIPQGEVVK